MNIKKNNLFARTKGKFSEMIDQMSKYLTDPPNINEGKHLGYYIKIISQFLVSGIFRMSESELPKSRRMVVRFFKTFVLSVKGFINPNLVSKASSLAYYSVMAIIPILALMTSIGRGFGFQTSIETFIVDNVGNAEIATFLMGLVSSYLEYAKGGVFVGIGVAILIWVAINLFRFVEKNLNQIWNVKKSRSIVKQLTTYITILVAVPLLIVISSSLSVAANNYVESVSATTMGSYFFPFYRFFLKLTPYLVYWILFTLLYMILPNTKVNLRSAFTAGFVAGTGVMILASFYINGQISLSRYNAVYGSVAAIPMLMFMLQLVWYVILYGAELSYVSQNLESYSFSDDTKLITRRYMDYTTVLITHHMVKNMEHGEAPCSARQIADTYNLPMRLTENVLNLLTDIQLVSEIYLDNEKEKTFQIAVDINQLSLEMLFSKINLFGSEAFLLNNNNNDVEHLWKVMAELQQGFSAKRQTMLIKDL